MEQTPLETLKRRVSDVGRPRNFFRALVRERNTETSRVIAEVKKSSPSAGLIREDFDPVAIAQQYQRGGAAAISCLTDERHFGGHLGYIQQIRSAVDLPVLRKDFIVDQYQIWESRAAGADAVLLIAEVLTEGAILDMLILARELGMTALVEVHDVENLLKVKRHIGFPHSGYSLLGINNRDLKSMTTDVSHTLRMLDMVEDTRIVVSESGIRSASDLTRLRRSGVYIALVGEHLLRQPNPEQALRHLLTPTHLQNQNEPDSTEQRNDESGLIRMSSTCDLVIPALDEQANIDALFDALEALPNGLVGRIVLADNGSSDDTAKHAEARGAFVVHEPQRGYGGACLKALAYLRDNDPPDVVAFIDADLADDPAALADVIEPVRRGDADLSIGCRPALAEPGALNFVQRFGNGLACMMMRVLAGVRYRDLGPMRAVRWSALHKMQMQDRTWGWTVEMQMKAALLGLQVAQTDVPYRNRRFGRSKISGTVRGATAAGMKIIATILVLWWQRNRLRRHRE